MASMNPELLVSKERFVPFGLRFSVLSRYGFLKVKTQMKTLPNTKAKLSKDAATVLAYLETISSGVVYLESLMLWTVCSIMLLEMHAMISA